MKIVSNVRRTENKANVDRPQGEIFIHQGQVHSQLSEYDLINAQEFHLSYIRAIGQVEIL